VTQLHFLRDWVVWASGVAFWVCLFWPAVIRLFWPWHRDEWGWNMVIKTELIAIALLSTTLHYEFGIQPGLVLEWIAVAAVTAIPVVVTWRTWIIYRAQQAGASERASIRRAARLGAGRQKDD
jgi:hypothetical protein